MQQVMMVRDLCSNLQLLLLLGCCCADGVHFQVLCLSSSDAATARQRADNSYV